MKGLQVEEGTSECLNCASSLHSRLCGHEFPDGLPDGVGVDIPFWCQDCLNMARMWFHRTATNPSIILSSLMVQLSSIVGNPPHLVEKV